MNLLQIYEENKRQNEKLKKQKEEENFNKELKEIIAEIIKGKEEYKTDSTLLLNRLNIKGKKEKRFYMWGEQYVNVIKLNKTNIQKIQKYIDKENK